MKIDESLAYDIGAFDGDTVSMINGLGYPRVVCFEPHPISFERMKSRHASNPNVVMENLAVSENSGQTVKMTVVPNHPYLNSLEPEWFSTGRHPSLGSHQIDVMTISLNDYIEKSGSIPAYIKVDAEGHEIPILKSLKYKPHRISLEWVSEFREKNLECLRLLRDLGFSKFKVGFTETIPAESAPSVSYEECCEQMRTFNELDKERKMWGNIWCL